MRPDYIYRFIQLFIQSSFFDLPILRKCRNILYTKMFNAGANLAIDKYVEIVARENPPKPTIKIGSNVCISRGADLDYSGGLIVGNDVAIGPNVLIETHQHVMTSGSLLKWSITYSPLEICDEAWIGANVIILDTVNRIGKGSIIAAGSVVSSDIPDMVIAAGYPARTIKKRENKTSE